MEKVRADVYLTGEMGHHQVIEANHKGIAVVLCEHSNTERGYLSHIIENLAGNLPGVELCISLKDKDPLEII